MPTIIKKATLEEVDKLAPLFDAYRVFYKQKSDIGLAREFIRDRLTKSDSTIFVAVDSDKDSIVGFAQLYPSFTSVGAGKIYILNDLYVLPEQRRAKVAQMLMQEAETFASENGAVKIILETQTSNAAAQALYALRDYKKEEMDFFTYSLKLPRVEKKDQLNTISTGVKGDASSTSDEDASKYPKSSLFSPPLGSAVYVAPELKQQDKKIVVITGVTKGLGRAMLDRFNELEWTVVGCGRTVEEVELLKKTFVKHHFEAIDISDEVAVTKWSAQIIMSVGVPSLLINNASIVNKNAPLWTISGKEFADVMNTNVNGVVNTIRAFLPAMMTKKEGVIINVSSGWGRASERELGPYCASKFAIEGLTQSLAAELPSGMIAVTLDPGGGINTLMLQKCAPQYVDESPSPEEWSHVAVPYILGIKSADNGKALTCPLVQKATKTMHI